MEPDANDHLSQHGWYHNNLTGRYERHVQACLATVWLVQSGFGWTASVNLKTGQLTRHNFASVIDAQAWCDAHIAQLQPKERESGA